MLKNTAVLITIASLLVLAAGLSIVNYKMARVAEQIFPELNCAKAQLEEAQLIIDEQDRIIDRMLVPYDFLVSTCQALRMSESWRESEMPENRNNPDYVIDADNSVLIRESIRENEMSAV